MKWRKSSYSGASAGTDCVELADLGSEVGLRDSKDPERGHLALAPETFAGLLAAVKAGELDL